MTSSTTRKTTIPASCWRQRSEHDIFQVPPKTAHLAAGGPWSCWRPFWIAREHRDWMNALERFVSAPIRRSLGSLCYRVSFSVMEVLYVLAAVLALAYVVWNITAVVRARGRRKRRAYSAVLGRSAPAERLRRYLPAVGGVLLHGHLPGPVRHPGGGGTLPDLTAVTAWFAENLAQTARPGAPG